MAVLDDEEVAASLMQVVDVSIPLHAYFLMGEPGRELIGFWLPEFGARVMLSRDASWVAAAKDFLSRRGARRFGLAEDLLEVARR